MARDSEVVSHFRSAPAYLALAHVARERNQTGRAASFLAEATNRVRQFRPPSVIALTTTEQVLLALATGKPQSGLGLLSDLGALRVGSRLQPMPDAHLRAAEAELLLAVGDLVGADAVFDRPVLNTADVRSARVHLAIARSNTTEAQQMLARWSPGTHEHRAALQHQLWTAVLDELRGDAGAARAKMADLVARTEGQGDVRLFTDASPHALRPLRALYHASPTPYLRRLIDALGTAGSACSGTVAPLPERLTQREYIVLTLLPTRKSNMQIAAQLEVSLDTVKTHLKHIYQKLGVSSRANAIIAAERLRLL
jgi:LuxR family maltose regulon positive regulatory protein